MKTDQIAAQLYTCRELLKTPSDIAKTFRRLRDCGYTAVQVTSMITCVTPKELAVILADEGLVCCATQEPSDKIRQSPHAVIEKLKDLGCSLTAYPFPANVNMLDLGSVRDLIRDLNRAGELMAAEGITLTYHNHGVEFIKIDGMTALERIYQETCPQFVQAEPDTYWIHYGGGDNVDWCRRLKGRLPMMHLKDYGYVPATGDGHPVFCEVGNGTLDFKSIIAAAEESGCKWFIVEQDTTPGDPVDSLAVSFRYLRDNVCA